jgi:DNA-binding IclR family transcriptional regulator
VTSEAKILSVLGLFTEDRPIWHAEEINETLHYARATGYRAVKNLVDAGFLQKVSAGRYALGARIIELDYQLRLSDPILLAIAPVMEELARKTGLSAVLTVLFGTKVVDTHRASVDPGIQLTYGRGRPRPLFQGAAPKMIISYLPRAQLVRLYQTHENEIARLGFGESWAEFRAQLAVWRNAAFYYSRGEVEAGVSGAAAPLFNAAGDVLAALTLVGASEQVERIGEARLKSWLVKATGQFRILFQTYDIATPSGLTRDAPGK